MTSLGPVALTHILVGRARPFGPNGEPSAIDKRHSTGPLSLTVTGVTGDEQGDPRNHGGPEKAVHHYPSEHYAAWRSHLPVPTAARLRIGAFGENFATTGLTEENTCIGDVFRLGNARIQVSQARQPCWKLNVRFGQADMARLVQEHARTGWYYRVLEPGEVAPGDELRLLDRPSPDWPLRRLLHHLYVDPLNTEGLAGLVALETLADSWRELARRRLASGCIEDWSRRLTTPAVTGRS